MQMDAFNSQMNGLVANVTIVAGSAVQRGDQANGILSENKFEFSTNAFSPEIVKCPSKDFASRSFIQITNKVEFSNKFNVKNEFVSKLLNKGKNKNKDKDKDIVKLDS